MILKKIITILFNSTACNKLLIHLICEEGNKNNNELQRNAQMIFSKYFDIDALCEYTSLSKTVIYRLMKDDEAKFPTPYNINFVGKRVVWVAEEIDDWFAKNIVKQEFAA